MKILSIFLVILTFPFLGKAQNKPAPSYLMGSTMPDSVLTMALISFDDQQTTLGQVLAAHTGQKIVLDLWASWCRDCIVSLPDLRQLMQDTEDHGVQYIFLSVDKEDNKWKTAIKKYKIPGEHYRTTSGWNTPLSNYIVLDWVPRYLVLDGQGQIILPKEVKAKSQTLRNALR
ncbi:hypothetical protein BFP72_17000 [Reichenbachiella sp. 5M10]|uniref:TlpA family protein disulfide reductase n=1 Tax=Reichenbachiella sp. 5M10 TaxID=1889772 RepID=UPI000C1456F5|nr:TlpA disulfide reductase family protein [Reichenbachiella sp. 5M10]PIB36980.1 hypothetical protein BFP72_17000 [Reichenbachiella sp. 5M10]